MTATNDDIDGVVQYGYPPHDYPGISAIDGKVVRQCNGPLLLPEAGGIDGADLWRRVQARRRRTHLPELPSGGVLYCAKCRAFVVADEERVGLARDATERDALGPNAMSVMVLPGRRRRVRVKADEATRNLFADPPYAAKLRLDGSAK